MKSKKTSEELANEAFEKFLIEGLPKWASKSLLRRMIILNILLFLFIFLVEEHLNTTWPRFIDFIAHIDYNTFQSIENIFVFLFMGFWAIVGIIFTFSFSFITFIVLILTLIHKNKDKNDR